MKQEYKTIGNVFEKYKIINVPYYQRDYVWGRKNSGRNLLKFIDDIFTQYKENQESDYFIGTLAFCSEQTHDIIDGQQRITSIILILTSLANNNCSEEITKKNKEMLFYNDNFIINEPNHLTDTLKYYLHFTSNIKNVNYDLKIDKTIEDIQKYIERNYNNLKKEWYNSLYEYILNRVKLISIEYNNNAEALKYFLNINSLSIQLTQSDIFYSILSQSLLISKSKTSIYKIKEKINNFSSKSKNKWLEKDIKSYKAYEPINDKLEKSIVNIIYIFLNAYFQNDRNYNKLNEAGVGKWLSFYKNDVFQDQLIAKDFTDSFIQFLNDIELISNNFTNVSPIYLEETSPLYTSWILLQYDKYNDLLEMLITLFKERHNYFENGKNIYKENTTEIDDDILKEISRRLNLTLISNYIENSNDKLKEFIDNIKITDNSYNKKIRDIIEDIKIESIFNLNYNDKKNLAETTIKDDSKSIKVIFALQESYLNFIANNSNNFNKYLENILLFAENFTIEHLYSIKEYQEKNRLQHWQNKDKFLDERSFDNERFSFENLSLLDKSSNSSAGDKEIQDKIKIYKNAKSVINKEDEYLIMSLVDNSEFYNNPKIKNLDLPNRAIKNIKLNTWDKSENNRDFNIKLLKLVINFISNNIN